MTASLNEELLKAQNLALEKLATGKLLPEIFDALTLGAEQIVDDACASILLLDNSGSRLFDGSSPSFSQSMKNAFHGMIIGPLEGSCGTAAYSKKLVLVEDISTDPRWKKFKDFAHSHGLKSCFSAPIINSDGNVLGTFALTFTKPTLPSETLVEIIQSSARIASLAIERKNAEAALIYSEERFRQLAENIKEVFWLEDLEGNEIVYISPAFEEVWGTPCAKLYENPRLWMDSIHPEDRERIIALYPYADRKNLIAGKYKSEFRIVRPDGSIRWISDQASPVFNEKGEPIRIAGISQDITSMKLAEKKLRDKSEELENKNIALAEIISQIEIEKRVVKDSVAINTEKLLLPLIEKIRQKDSIKNKKVYDLLENSLKDITSEFGSKISNQLLKLSPREIEVANLIKNGFESKEIASHLGVSYNTIETHRRNIRKKLGIANEKTNLTSYLQSI